LSGILLAIIAAIAWGSIVLVSNKLGGDANSQTIGTTFGALIFAAGVYIFTTPHMSALVWSVGIISGIFWTIGQKNQYGTVKFLGVAKTVPMSTGLQLIGTTIFGALLFHEWKTKTQVIVGILALACIIAGAALTSFGQKTEEKDGGKDLKKGLMILLVSTVGYVVYVVIVKWFNINGWSAILPQAIGMVLSGIVLTIRHHPFNKFAARNLLTGLIWATGNLTLLLSLPSIGVATSFSLSQTGIVISTLGGIFLLGEKTSKKQVISVIIGCLLIIAGGVMVGLTKK
jgi:glucose uptake protein